MAPLRYAAKFDPFLSLDCAPTPSTLKQSKERKGSNFATQRSGAVVLQARRAEQIQSKNLANAIWQPCREHKARVSALVQQNTNFYRRQRLCECITMMTVLVSFTAFR